MSCGDLIQIREWPLEKLRFGILIKQLNWREVMELQIRCKQAWWIHFPDADETLAYDEDLIILLSEDEYEYI